MPTTGPPLAPVVVVASFIWTGLLDYSAFELDFLWKVLAWSKVESLTSIQRRSLCIRRQRSEEANQITKDLSLFLRTGASTASFMRESGYEKSNNDD